MSRILAIDFGLKRTGIAVTDPLKIIATALETVPSAKLLEYLKTYMATEAVETIVLGLPIDLKSNDTDATTHVRKFGEKLQTVFPATKLVYYDERFTSKMAVRTMIDSGMKKKDRQVKGNIDKISAVIILQDYMASL